jgi:hypothetical protein
MTCVSHAGSSDEMWWFSTSTRGWERVDKTLSNGAGPSARFGHVMTSVGLDLCVHGGYGYGEILDGGGDTASGDGYT